MNAGSLRKDCLADFLPRWVDWVAGADFGGFGFITSLRSPPPPPPPPAAKTGVKKISAIGNVARTTNLITNLIILCLLFHHSGRVNFAFTAIFQRKLAM